MGFGNVNYSPEVAGVLGNSFAAMMIAQAAVHPKSVFDQHHRKVAIGHVIQAAGKLHLKDWEIDRLVDAMEAQLDEMLDSDAVEVYERYEAYRQAERDELERMEAESERNYLADLDAQREYNFESEQAIERRATA